MNQVEFRNNAKRFVENYDPQTHYQERKNFLQDAFKEIMLDGTRFRIMNTYTNSGKSFTATHSIVELYDEFEQLVFLFNKKSNMPNYEYMNKEIEKRYGIKNAVLFIDNNTDNLLTNRHQLDVLKERLLNTAFLYPTDIDEDIREELLIILESLILSVKTYYNVKSDKDMKGYFSSDYVEFLTEQVRKNERTFKNIIKKHYKTKSITEFNEFYEYTKNHNVFSCLLELYPYLSFPNKKIIIMTVDKFYLPMDFIIDSAPDFLASKGIGKNTIFIIDESDETYWNRLKKIVDTGATRNQDFDLFTLAKDIYNGTKYRDRVSLAIAPNDECFATRLGEDSNSIKQAFAFLQNIDCGNSEFRDISRYKLVANEECKKVNIFISKDMGVQLEVEGNVKGRVKCSFDEENELIHLYVDENDDDGNNCYFIDIVSQILDAEKFFKKTVFSLAIAYYESELPYRPDFTKVKALTTLLSAFTGNSSLAQKYSTIFTDEFESIYSAKPSDSEKLLSNDFSLISIESFATILGEGYLRTTENNKSPEQELVRLIQNSKKVLFLSATGALKSVLCNYNIDAVCEYLGLDTDEVMASPEAIMLYKESTEYMQKNYFPTKCTLYDDIGSCSKKNILYEAMLQKQHREISAILYSKKFMNIHGIKSRKKMKEFLNKIDPSRIGHLFTQYNSKTDKKLGAIRFYDIFLSILHEMEKGTNRSELIFANGDDFYILSKMLTHLNEEILPESNQICFERFVAIGKEGINDKTVDLFFNKKEQKLKDGAIFILLTTYNSAAAGVNFFRIIDSEQVDFSDELNDGSKHYYGKFTDEERLVSGIFEHPSLDNEHTYLKADIDAIFAETKTHLIPNPDGTNDICRFHSFYILTALCKRDKDYSIFSETKRIETCNEIYNMNINKANPLHGILKYYSVNITDFAVAFLRNLAQTIGRRSRNSFGTKDACVYVCNDKWTKAITNLKKYGFDTALSVIPDTQAIIDAFLNYEEPTRDYIDCNGSSIILKKSVESLFDKNIPENSPYKELYKRIIKKEHWLTLHPTMSQKEMDEKCANDKIFEMFADFLYIENTNHISGYVYETDDNYNCSAGWLNNGYISGREFSASSLYYDILEKYLSLSDNPNKPKFNANDEYIVNPVFADVVRGDVGELLFESIIIYKNLISELKKNYEFFDYSINGKNKVVDIKYYDTNDGGFKNRIKEKLDHIEDKLDEVFNEDKTAKVLFVNMFPCEASKHNGIKTLTKNVYLASSIIDEDGEINTETLDAIINFLTV